MHSLQVGRRREVALPPRLLERTLRLLRPQLHKLQLHLPQALAQQVLQVGLQLVWRRAGARRACRGCRTVLPGDGDLEGRELAGVVHGSRP